MAAAVIDHHILPAEYFNRIPDFNDQDKVVDKTTLDELGQIFVAYHMHGKAGVGLLHRHDNLTENQVMVHEIRDLERDVAIPEDVSRLQTDKFGPYAFFLNQEDHFQAYEYDNTGNSLVLTDEFAVELRDYLKTHKLERKIAIVPNPKLEVGRGKSIEYTHPSGVGTIRIPLEEDSPSENIMGEATTTCWSFSVKNAKGVESERGGTCRTTADGVHRLYAVGDLDHREEPSSVPQSEGMLNESREGNALSSEIGTERISLPEQTECSGDIVCLSRPGGFHYRYTSMKPLPREGEKFGDEPSEQIESSGATICLWALDGSHRKEIGENTLPPQSDISRSSANSENGDNGVLLQRMSRGSNPESSKNATQALMPSKTVEVEGGTICVPTDQGDHFRYLYSNKLSGFD